MLYVRFLFLILLLETFTGCNVGRPYNPPTVDVPLDWKNPSYEFEEPPIVENWWEVFEDSRLNELECIALNNNKNLLIAIDRILEARDLANIVKASLYPQIDLLGTYDNVMQLIKTFNPPVEVVRAHQLLYSLTLNLSYEVDLWGKLRNQYRASLHDWEAQYESYLSTLLTLTTDLAITYYQLRMADSQIEILKSTIEIRERTFKLNQDRYNAQISNYADVATAGLDLSNAIIDYDEALRQRSILENRIAILLGFPASCFTIENLPLIDCPPEIPAGIPSEILKRRPDIAEAERRMASAHSLVNSAYANFFPSVMINSYAGFESPVSRDFLTGKSRTWEIGAMIDQSVFDGGRNCANLALQQDSYRETVDLYKQQVILAFQEVEDALNNLDNYQKEYLNAYDAVEWARKSYTLNNSRYRSGVTNYLNVLISERDQLAAEINLNFILGYRYISTIQLIKALGGGWLNVCD